MNNFINKELKKNKIYFFLGSIELIDNFTQITDFPNKEKNICLGKFLGYIGFIYNHDWVEQAKAQFENGIINCGNYDLIYEFVP